MPYDYKPFPYVAPPGLSGPEKRHNVIIVGAGPIGLAMALELANFGQPSVVLDDNNVVSVGSRAICWSKRSLEILDRLGIGQRCVDKGVIWQVGRTYRGDDEVFQFDLLPEDGHKRPAFVNLQQYYVEEYLVEKAQQNDLVDLRFKNKVISVSQSDASTTVGVETPDGAYELEADYVLACDGANSPMRSMMGLEFQGELFEEKFLICDLRFNADFTSERRFWFEPTFHTGQTALLHKQADETFRIDLQLGWDADVEEEKKLENVRPRIAQFLGHSDFEVDWLSIYTFQCRRLEKFVHGRVLFVGDSAHVVSPFGARGGNGGMQDVDALGWRLAAILDGRATETVLANFDAERTFGADENIANSARATKFMTPADGIERLFRDQVLALAGKAPFARSWVNSGRLSVPCVYPSDGADDPGLPKGARPGSVAPDAPLGDGWLIDALGGRPVLMTFGTETPHIDGLETISPEVTDTIRQRYLGDKPAAAYLVRPDQVIAGRWPYLDPVGIETTLRGLWGRS